ncbi:hypothetical protein [Ralstonia phage RP12]|uniref:Uncharacterized protein n=1 Tax=Ralstonia phage RP12 TaxID=1923889 RepID=A0A1L7N0Q2_9CAUD|nr:hypothetical protein FDH28_gp064 [Ralstonia phage RP12]BAW19038.1 hypothetical protein [Ralstonia phage RP12]
MAFIQLLVSLWPFLKEMFVGDKIKDQDATKEGASGKQQDKKMQFVSDVARWCVDKMQQSRRFLFMVLVILMLSLFINYKVIGKLMALAPRHDEHQAPHQPAATEKHELPTIPRPGQSMSERDVLYEQTVRELNVLYGEPRK